MTLSCVHAGLGNIGIVLPRYVMQPLFSLDFDHGWDIKILIVDTFLWRLIEIKGHLLQWRDS